ncbi:MAG: SDR family oxidoreductase [Eubacteriales bacterium]
MKNLIILVTGASSGIGKSTAEAFVKAGHLVFGTSRKSTFEDSVELSKVNMIPMETTDEKSVKRAVDFVLEKAGGLDILVNCAGYGIAGSIEGVPVSEAKRQFDVNFFGTLAVIQAVLPHFRSQGQGQIINIGSVAGYIPIPFQSMYSAAKFALESLTETLAMETKKFGITVSLVEPGDTKTGFTASRIMSAKKDIEENYMPESQQAIEQMEKDEQNGYSPDRVAKTVLRVAGKKHPPVRVTVGFSYKLFYGLSKILPTKLKLFVLKLIY